MLQEIYESSRSRPFPPLVFRPFWKAFENIDQGYVLMAIEICGAAKAIVVYQKVEDYPE